MSIQIVSLSENKLVFHPEKLESLLASYDSNLPLVVISVVGAFRSGKSLLLNYFLKTLFKENTEGFRVAPGRKRVTTGLWLWNKVGIHQKTAYLLMDTQGLFDTETTQALTTKIFAAGTLISSMLIFNVNRQIQEDHLEYLALFSEYANLINTNVFQSLDFLVRDWQHEEITGEQYLSELFTHTTGDTQMIDIRNSITNIFQEKHCSMLPFPGYAINDHTVDTNKLNPDFNRRILEFVQRILNRSKIKKIGQVELVLGDIKNTIREYIQEINNNILITDNILTATAKIVSNTLCSRAFEVYVKELKQNYTTRHQFRTRNTELRRQAIAFFDTSDHIGNDRYYQQSKLELLKKIDEHSKLYIQTIQMKLEWRTPTAIGCSSFLIDKLWVTICTRVLVDAVCVPTAMVFQAIYTFSIILLAIRYMATII